MPVKALVYVPVFLYVSGGESNTKALFFLPGVSGDSKRSSGIQMSCSAQEKPAVRDGRWEIAYFPALSIEGHWERAVTHTLKPNF